MKAPVTVMALVIASCAMTFSQASSEEPRHLRGHQFAVYHACLYNSSIHDWCHMHDVAFRNASFRTAAVGTLTRVSCPRRATVIG